MKTFSPGESVVFRITNEGKWHYGIYDCPDLGQHCVIGHNSGCHIHPNNIFKYDDKTKTLIGTKTDYTGWEPKIGDVIAVRNSKKDAWYYRIFAGMTADGKYLCVTDGTIIDTSLLFIEEPNPFCTLWLYATSIKASLQDNICVQNC